MLCIYTNVGCNLRDNKMNYDRIKDRNGIIDFAKRILNKKNGYVILDTETTGFESSDVIIQLGRIDIEGNILLDTYIKPTKKKKIPKSASDIHGINIEMLKDSPTFKEVYPKFQEVVKNKTILIYNAEYDGRMLVQTAKQDGIHFETFNAMCIMIGYSAFVGNWSDYYKGYKFQKLKGGDHTAIGDCKATLELVKKMASAEKIEPPKKKWWQF